MSEYMLQMSAISKSFGDVLANDGIDLAVRKGEVRAIVGENGAGKSTLMKILNGLYPPDSGEIFIDGESVTIATPGAAARLGIGMVYQHFMLVPTLSVVENMILGVEPGRFGLLDMRTAREQVIRTSNQYGLKIDPDEKVSNLSVGVQQRVEILKILFKGARILVFDEPTAVLTPQEVRELYKIIRKLISDGKTILFITHKLNEVLEIADMITVLRQGKCAGELAVADATKEKIATMMVGRKVLFDLKKIPVKPGDAVLEIKNLFVNNDKGLPAVENLSLAIRAGEIVGIAGVDGNGQTELVEAINGLRKIEHGSILVDGRLLSGKRPRTICESGVSHIPEDRHRRAAIGQFSIADNLVLGVHYSRYAKGFKKALLDFAAIFGDADKNCSKYDIRPALPRKIFSKLSGGNQQKVVVARELEKDHRVMIAAQPTRGVDIGAIEAIHNMLLAEKAQMKAILVISAELSEILNLSDRIAVMYEGQIIGIMERKEATEEKIGILMTGGRLDA